MTGSKLWLWFQITKKNILKNLTDKSHVKNIPLGCQAKYQTVVVYLKAGPRHRVTELNSYLVNVNSSTCLERTHKLQFGRSLGPKVAILRPKLAKCGTMSLWCFSIG